MTSSFSLELDTTPPGIELLAPNYTTTYAETEIIVQADEPVDSWQDIYLLDARGVRHDLLFRQEPDAFVGVVVLETYGSGIMTVYARVRDEVQNVSELARKTIDVRVSIDLDIRTDTETRGLTDRTARRSVVLQDKIRKIEVADS